MVTWTRLNITLYVHWMYCLIVIVKLCLLCRVLYELKRTELYGGNVHPSVYLCLSVCGLLSVTKHFVLFFWNFVYDYSYIVFGAVLISWTSSQWKYNFMHGSRFLSTGKFNIYLSSCANLNAVNIHVLSFSNNDSKKFGILKAVIEWQRK